MRKYLGIMLILEIIAVAIAILGGLIFGVMSYGFIGFLVAVLVSLIIVAPVVLMYAVNDLLDRVEILEDKLLKKKVLTKKDLSTLLKRKKYGKTQMLIYNQQIVKEMWLWIMWNFAKSVAINFLKKTQNVLIAIQKWRNKEKTMEEVQVENNQNQPKKMSNKAIALLIVGVIAISTVIALLIVFAIDSPSENSYLNIKNFNQISNGMTYEQVVEILDDHEGTLQSSAGSGEYLLEYYNWTNDSGTKIIVVGFQNGLVTAKSQIGLK